MYNYEQINYLETLVAQSQNLLAVNTFHSQIGGDLLLKQIKTNLNKVRATASQQIQTVIYSLQKLAEVEY